MTVPGVPVDITREYCYRTIAGPGSMKRPSGALPIEYLSSAVRRLTAVGRRKLRRRGTTVTTAGYGAVRRGTAHNGAVRRRTVREE